ncbi:mediator-replication checkpoint 1 [Schizosaccharomyces octosporus yFS286]|uniref:Mediator-replication checkpoint 1 n=1 Tax=Schizosaccharomyces octosporus (strain yFS286) TaxID=483514 RepID=S9Q0M9_SCHOY|nr:mediator-replication checkpoint 1 [Schizosaccharomyces octosporus yFS286]EPX73752.1 mediator-replication checkpoint 1 [Schizosaccharomyces octosporus yFS286]
MDTIHQNPIMDSEEAVCDAELSKNEDLSNELLETPRTRVKRMLAKFDDDYEPAANANETETSTNVAQNSSETQMDDDLQSKFSSAYERVKKRLQSEKKNNNVTYGKENLEKQNIESDNENALQVSTPSSPVEQEPVQAPLDRESRLKQLVEKKKKELKAQQDDLFNQDEPAALNDSSSDAGSKQDEAESESKSYRMERGYRKASKKALLDLHRNTAKLTREVVRNPEIKVGKKVTLSDFFGKIGFKPKTENGNNSNDESVSSQKISEEPSSKENDQPEESNGVYPLNSTESSDNVIDKGMKAGELDLPDLGQSSLFSKMLPKEATPKLSIKDKIQKLSKKMYTETSDSESDLEIETRPKTVTLDTIQSAKSSENVDTVTERLKKLAGIRVPTKGNTKPEDKEFNLRDFNRELMKRAAMMSKAEREETEKELAEQGLLVSDADKDEEEQLGYIERARKQAEKIRQREHELDGDGPSEDEEETAYEDVSVNKTPKTVISDVIIQATQTESSDTSMKKRKNNRVVMDDDEMEEQNNSPTDMRVVDSDNEDDDLRIDDFSQTPKENKEEKESKEDPSSFYFQNMLPPDSQLSIVDANFSQPPPRWTLPNSTSPEEETIPTQLDALVPTQLDATIPTQVDSSKKDESSQLVKTQVDHENYEATSLPRKDLLQRRPEKEDAKVNFTNFVEDQAEESEDEYAGMGGVSDEDEGNEELEPEIKNMIDDETDLKKEEIASMARYARDQEIDKDNKLVEQLMKDVTTGGLRKRHRNNAGLLDDSDDDDDEHNAIRREKLKELRRRKLMEHENLEILGGGKRQAFLATVEDNLIDTTDNLHWLDNNDEDSGIGSSELGEEHLRSDPAEVDDEDATREKDGLLEKANRNYVDRSELSKVKSKTSLTEKDDIDLPATLRTMIRKSKKSKLNESAGDLSSSNPRTSTLVSSTQRTTGRKFKGLMQVSNTNNRERSQNQGSQATTANPSTPSKPNLLASLNNFSDFD